MWKPSYFRVGWRSVWLRSTARAQMEPSPGGTAESHTLTLPHTGHARSIKTHPHVSTFGGSGADYGKWGADCGKWGAGLSPQFSSSTLAPTLLVCYFWTDYF